MNSNRKSNQELYRSAFSGLHASGTLNLEEMKMKKHITGLRVKRRFASVVLVFTMLFAMACVSYAATDGQIFETIRLMINGESYEGEMSKTEDGYIISDLKQGSDTASENAAENSADENVA